MTEQEFDEYMDEIIKACPSCTPTQRLFGNCSCEIRMDILRRNYVRQNRAELDKK
jgi:hypothetical protein